MNSDAKLLEKLIKEYFFLAPEKIKRQKEKVFRKGILADFTNEITKDWYIADLFDVTHLITCGVAKRPEYVEEGIPFLSAQNARPFKANLNKIRYIDKETFEKITVGGKPEKNDVLYTRVGNCGEAAKITYDFDFGVYVSLTLIKPIRELLDSDYLVAFLNSRFGLMQAGQGAIGIGLKNLNVDNVRRYIIPLPPLAEQKQIAKKLDELLAQVDTIKTRLDTIPTILKRFHQSVLAAAVSGKLSEDWRTNHKIKNIEYEDYLVSADLPDSWRIVPLGDYVENLDNQREPISTKERESRQGNYPYFGASGQIDTIDGYTHDGDFILIGEDGANLVARTKPIAYPVTGKVWVNNHAHVLRCKPDYENTYFEYYINSIDLTPWVSGTAQPKLNQKNMNNIPIPVAPKEEQTEIVVRVRKLFAFADHIEQRVKDAQTRVNSLTQSILAKAFRGELTAEWRDQNQNLISGENSAEALLERIKVEKEMVEMTMKLSRKTGKKKVTTKMIQKEIIPIMDALKVADMPLDSQALLIHAGYPLDASIDELERFFLDIREQLKNNKITKVRSGNEDIFSLA